MSILATLFGVAAFIRAVGYAANQWMTGKADLIRADADLITATNKGDPLDT